MISFQLNPATLCKRFSLLLLLLPVIIVWRCYLLFSIWLTQGGAYGVLMKLGATFRTDDAKKLTRCGFAHLHIACYVSALVLTKVNTLNKLKVTYTRDVTTGATGATQVAPKFSDTLTLSQSRGRGRLCPPSQRSQLTFSHGYVPEPKLVLQNPLFFTFTASIPSLPYIKKRC